MWIKVKTINDIDVFVNADKLSAVYPFATEEGQGCNLFFDTSKLPLKVKTTFNQLDILLDVNSIEKVIDKLKIEKTQLRLQMQFDKAFNKAYGTRAKKKHTEGSDCND